MKHTLCLITLPMLIALSACSGSKTGASAAVVAAPDQSFENWQVATVIKPDPLCYAVTPPETSDDTLSAERGKPYLMVTRRTSGKEEVSASAAYAVDDEGDIWLAAGKKKFNLHAKGKVAWAEDDAQDKAILAVLQSAKRVVVRTQTANGETSRDVYLTKGIKDALERVRELCP